MNVVGVSKAVIRAIGFFLVGEFKLHYKSQAQDQPGKMFFPKRVHERGPAEPNVPAGDTPEYLAIAALENGRARAEGFAKPVSHQSALFEAVLHEFEDAVEESVLLESALIEKLAKSLL